MEMKDSMPKFSIIVPIYNVEPYLRECIDSVLVQTFQDFELILVDDGSPDGSPAICDEYADKDIRIQVIHKKNGGLSDARNAGLDYASGEYIYFLDADDSILPDLLEKTVVEMSEGADMVVFGFQNQYETHTALPEVRAQSGIYTMESEADRLGFIQKNLLPHKIGWEAWSRIFRRDLIEQYELRFADNRKIFAEDMYFNLCYCAHASKIVCLDTVLYNYRMREDSIMGVQKRRNNIGRINELGKAVLSYYSQFEECKILVGQFDLIHTQIIVGQFINQFWTSGIDPLEFQRETWETVEDWDFLERNLRSAVRSKKRIFKIGSLEYGLQICSHIKFILGGSWTALRIKCKLIRILRPILK